MSSPNHSVAVASEWLFGSGSPSPELLAGARDFDHLEHVPRSPPRANACTVLSTRAPCGPRRRKHEKRPAALREKLNHSGKSGHFLHSIILLCLWYSYVVLFCRQVSPQMSPQRDKLRIRTCCSCSANIVGDGAEVVP